MGLTHSKRIKRCRVISVVIAILAIYNSIAIKESTIANVIIAILIAMELLHFVGCLIIHEREVRKFMERWM